MQPVADTADIKIPDDLRSQVVRAQPRWTLVARRVSDDGLTVGNDEVVMTGVKRLDIAPEPHEIIFAQRLPQIDSARDGGKRQAFTPLEVLDIAATFLRVRARLTATWCRVRDIRQRLVHRTGTRDMTIAGALDTVEYSHRGNSEKSTSHESDKCEPETGSDQRAQKNVGREMHAKYYPRSTDACRPQIQRQKQQADAKTQESHKQERT